MVGEKGRKATEEQVSILKAQVMAKRGRYLDMENRVVGGIMCMVRLRTAHEEQEAMRGEANRLLS